MEFYSSYRSTKVGLFVIEFDCNCERFLQKLFSVEKNKILLYLSEFLSSIIFM